VEVHRAVGLYRARWDAQIAVRKNRAQPVGVHTKQLVSGCMLSGADARNKYYSERAVRNM